ncbi:prohead core protein [Paraglaciecola Antarctic GD virus 1]|nr:prohead core protein [Paraglaciecola Antarctic GD virus 1]
MNNPIVDPELGLSIDPLLEKELEEKLIKKVNPDGSISKVMDKKTRTRKATQTTGLSKSKRRLIAKKAAKTKKKDVGGVKKANRKRKKTVKKRKNLGL